MKKLVIAATALLLSLGVNAQDQAGGTSVSTIGGVATPVVVGGVVAVGVAAAIISNAGGVSLPDTVEPVETCNAGDGEPVNGVCTGTTTATVTGTTAITTVTFTYPAIVQ
ncbi:hypothetical protein [Rheinheimera sp. WS51]|uniref:hypothetical protein n=1 Tax=Rheinheimera sp. WS51 TaxID=3425886 RepID=UPI003D92DA2C